MSKSCLCILDTSPFSDIWLESIFSYSVGCRYYFLGSVLWSRERFNFDEVWFVSFLHHLPIISFSFPMTIQPPEFYLWSSSSFLSFNFSLRWSIPSPLQGNTEWLNIGPPYIIFCFFSLLYFCTWHTKCVPSILLNEWKNLRKVTLLF